jgi:DNA-binding NarL/FixJ family response regulator
MPMPLAGMTDTLTVVVAEQGTALTHELTLACRGKHVEVLGPVKEPEEVRRTVRTVGAAVVLTEAVPPAIRELVVLLPSVRVLAMTDTADPGASAAAIAAGAAGVLERGADRRVLVDGLRRAAVGELVLPASHLAALVHLVDTPHAGDNPRDRMRKLTRREREILSLLAQGRTTSDIARTLSISVLTVQSHVKNLLAKLGVHSKVEAIRYAWRSGELEIPVGA